MKFGMHNNIVIKRDKMVKDNYYAIGISHSRNTINSKKGEIDYVIPTLYLSRKIANQNLSKWKEKFPGSDLVVLKLPKYF
jgi:hypothetical protein